jgi:hypothetical protein
MSLPTALRLALALGWLAGASGAAADVVDYARRAVNEAFLAEPRRPDAKVAFAGATPPADQAAVSRAVLPFVWVTNVPGRVSDVASADLVFVHLRSFKDLATAGLDPAVAAVIQENIERLQQSGLCTKFTERRPGGRARAFVFLSLEDHEAIRASCLYGQVRSLFGLLEDVQIGEFADTFLADMTIARCISQIAPSQLPPEPGAAKAAIVKALADLSCGRGPR